MPALTPGRSYPYPIGTDPIDTAGDIERLAKAIDTGPPAGTDQYGNPLSPAVGALLGHVWGQAVEKHIVHVYPTVAAMKAMNPTPADGMICAIVGLVSTDFGWGLIKREGNVWVGDRTVTNGTTSDSTGLFFIPATAFGFVQIIHASIVTSKGFPASGTATNVEWIRNSGSQVDVMLTDQPSGASAPNRSITYSALIRGNI